MKIRRAEEQDYDRIFEIWTEIHWADGSERGRKGFDAFHRGARCYVAELEGTVQSAVATHDCTTRYLDQELPCLLVSAVTTSLVARKQGLAGRLTAAAIDRSLKARPAVMTVLGIFDQGYYDRLGFGTGNPMTFYHMRPGQLRVPYCKRIPTKFSAADVEAIHHSRLDRMRLHLGTSVLDSGYTEETLLEPRGFGLGFRDDRGAISHHVWLSSQGEEGPIRVKYWAYQSREQLLDLLGLLRNFDDQIFLIKAPPVPGVNLQELFERPFQHIRRSGTGTMGCDIYNYSIWQIRISDLPAAIAAMRLPGRQTLRFNLELDDPIVSRLEDDSQWSGIGGQYVVELGAESSIEAGRLDGLPSMRCDVSQFSRLWAGSESPFGISLLPEVEMDPGLVDALGSVVLLPKPEVDWNF